MAKYIAEHGALPIYDVSSGIHHTTCFSPDGPCVGSYASLPPAGPILSAAFMKLQHLLTGQPYDMLLFAARMPSAICVASFVLLLYWISRELVADVRVRLTVLFIGALIPQVTFIGAYVNDDAIGLASGTLLLHRSLVMLRSRFTVGECITLGLSASALALSKLDYYPTLLGFGLLAAGRWAIARKEGEGARFLLKLGTAGVVAMLASGWFFVRNFVLYQDPTGAAVMFRSFKRAAPGYSMQSLAGQGYSFPDVFRSSWLTESVESFWARFDYMSLAPPSWVYKAILAVTIVALTGAAVQLASRLGHWRRERLNLESRWLGWVSLLLTAMGAVLLSAWTSYANAFQPQGRYMFAGLPGIVMAMAWGLHGWSTHPTYRAMVVSATCLGMVTLNAMCLLVVIVPAYYAWPG